MATGTVSTSGGISLPVPPIVDSLHEADPLLSTLLPLMRAAINAELGGDSDTIVAGSPWATASAGTELAGTLPVSDLSWRPPTSAHLREAQKLWPLLSIYRTGERETSDYSTEASSADSTLELHYIMSPLTAAGVQRLAGALPIVARVVRRVLTNAGHPAYMSGASVLRDEALGLVTIGIDAQVQYGPAAIGSDGSGAEFWACSIPLVARELSDDDAEAAPPFMGAYVDLEYADGSRVINVDTQCA